MLQYDVESETPTHLFWNSSLASSSKSSLEQGSPVVGEKSIATPFPPSTPRLRGWGRGEHSSDDEDEVVEGVGGGVAARGAGGSSDVISGEGAVSESLGPSWGDGQGSVASSGVGGGSDGLGVSLEERGGNVIDIVIKLYIFTITNQILYYSIAKYYLKINYIFSVFKYNITMYIFFCVFKILI